MSHDLDGLRPMKGKGKNARARAASKQRIRANELIGKNAGRGAIKGAAAAKSASSRLLRIDGEIIDATDAAKRLGITRDYLLNMFDKKGRKTWADLSRRRPERLP